MATTQPIRETPIRTSKLPVVDMKLEAVIIPVADVDRAKGFYESLGWRLDGDFVVGNEFRGVQFTPPGSHCSIQFGKGLGAASPGSPEMYLVVSDIEAARAAFLARGVEVSEVFHRAGPGRPAEPGKDPEGHSYGSFMTFSDPDGNRWIVQEVTVRLPGRIDGDDTTFSSSRDLASALERAANAHGEHEKRIGHHDANWPAWYAEYLVKEQSGKPLPS